MWGFPEIPWARQPAPGIQVSKISVEGQSDKRRGWAAGMTGERQVLPSIMINAAVARGFGPVGAAGERRALS